MQKLVSYLKMFLKKDIGILLQGDRAIIHYEHQLPDVWKEILLTQTSITSAMETIWQPIIFHLRDSVRIIDQIINIGLVVAQPQPSPIGLAYIFKHTASDELFSWLGYPPINPDQLFQFKEKHGFTLPASYQEFSAIHNGLLRDGWSSHGLKPIEKLQFFELGQKENLSRRQLLAFSGDGAGNEQCYDLNLPADSNDYLTVDWDHESHMTGQPHTFWAYFEALLKLEMGIRDLYQ